MWGEARQGWGRAGWGASKNSKPIPVLLHGVGLKSHLIPALPPLQGGENPYGAKRGGAKLPSLTLPTKITNKMRGWIFVVGFLKSGEKFFQKFLGFLFFFFIQILSSIFLFNFPIFSPKNFIFFYKKIGGIYRDSLPFLLPH